MVTKLVTKLLALANSNNLRPNIRQNIFIFSLPQKMYSMSLFRNFIDKILGETFLFFFIVVCVI